MHECARTSTAAKPKRFQLSQPVPNFCAHVWICVCPNCAAAAQSSDILHGDTGPHLWHLRAQTEGRGVWDALRGAPVGMRQTPTTANQSQWYFSSEHQQIDKAIITCPPLFVDSFATLVVAKLRRRGCKVHIDIRHVPILVMNCFFFIESFRFLSP